MKIDWHIHNGRLTGVDDNGTLWSVPAPDEDHRGPSTLRDVYAAWLLKQRLLQLRGQLYPFFNKETVMGELGDHVDVVLNERGEWVEDVRGQNYVPLSGYYIKSVTENVRRLLIAGKARVHRDGQTEIFDEPHPKDIEITYPIFTWKEVTYTDREPSNVLAYGMSFDVRVLTVEFKRRASEVRDAYHYFDFPLDLYTGLDEASSKGNFLQQHIKPYFKDPATYERVVPISDADTIELLQDLRLACYPPILLKPSPVIEGSDSISDIVTSLQYGRAMALPAGAEIEVLHGNMEQLHRRLARHLATLRYRVECAKR